MKPFTLIILILITNQVFTQSLSKKLEVAYQQDSQRELKITLKEFSINNSNKSHIPDSVKEYYEVYNSIISQSRRIWPDWINLGIQIPLIKYKDSFKKIQNQLIYGRTDSSLIELFMETKHIEFDTIINFIPYADYKKPQLIHLTDTIQREFEVFLNLENKNINELQKETEKSISKAIEKGYLLQYSVDSFTIVSIDKNVSQEDIIRQKASRGRIDFLRKQIGVNVGDFEKGYWDWKIKPSPDIKYMIMDYRSRKAWVLYSFCLVETIWVKNDKEKWIFKEYVNTGCL